MQKNQKNNGQTRQGQATLRFEKGMYLPNQALEISFEEIRHVINLKPSEGFYFQIGDKKTISTETNILVRIKNVNLVTKKEMQSALIEVVKDLKLVPYQTKARLTGQLGERRGQYIVDPKFMHKEITSNPGLRFKTYLKDLKTENEEKTKPSNQASKKNDPAVGETHVAKNIEHSSQNTPAKKAWQTEGDDPA